MNIYLLLAHPDSGSFNGQIADAYYQAALEKGHEVRYQKLGEMTFDPILWEGYTKIQELEPDLKEAQENLLWCDKWVIVYPVWWGSVPALFKGFMDRVLLPGFAFKYRKNSSLWDKLLRGRSAELITTSDSPGWWLWWYYRNSDLSVVKTATLEFCGFSPVRVTRIGGVKSLSREGRQKSIDKVTGKISTAETGRRALADPR